MAESGTVTFASPDDYRAAIRAGTVNLIVTGGGSFNARLTWLNLGHLHVFRGREKLPRIGFFSLSPAQTFVSFPTKAGAPLTYGGIGLRFGDLVLHSRGERMHQRIDGEGQWGFISLPPEQLAACSKALTGYKHRVATGRPGTAAATERRQTFVGAPFKDLSSRRNEHQLIANPEVARALEQELIHALVNCLTVGDAGGNLKKRRHHTDIMIRFEDALAAIWRPTSELACALFGDRRAGANITDVLH